jgi:acetyl-CoA carboxylase biotin carboxylase subunit
MVRALTEYDLRGIGTTIGFCRNLVRSPQFAAGEFDTTYVDRVLEQNGTTGEKSGELEEIAAIAAAMWEMEKVRLKAETTEATGTHATGTEPTTVVSGFSRTTHDSLWSERARLESLR